MPLHFLTNHRSTAGLAAAVALLLTLSACIPASTTGAPARGTVPATGSSSLPSAHVHGLSVNRETDQVLLATHEGLFDIAKAPAAKIGDTNDLMGFTASDDEGTFYASGHPGPGSDLPSPLGLIKSVDGGKTWELLPARANRTSMPSPQPNQE